MAVKDYKTNPDENTTISGINIAEGCPPSGINNAIRQLMADVKQNADEQDESIEKATTTIMTGATANAAGTSGNVPAPQKGQQNKPLTGGGKFADSLDCNITGNAATATGLYNSEGEPISAQVLANLLAKYLPITGGSLTGLLSANLGINIPNIFSATPDYNINLSKTTNFYQLQYGSLKNNDVIVSIRDSQHSITVPAGGYWACIIVIYDKKGNAGADLSGVYAGGTILQHANYYASGLFVRVY